MTFRFIHTADWQLGKPFANLPPDLAGELSAARFSAIERIAAIARARNASHVLVAGDIFDGEDLPNAILRRGLERMAEFATIVWVLLPGNHDPARPGGVWDRMQRFGFPRNVVAALSAAPLTLADRVALLPAPLTTKNPGRDPTAWMDTAATPEGVLRIGLAHGSVQGFGGDCESSVSISRDRATAAGLAYLALGDWHGLTRVTAETWYSGTPEPDRFPSNEPGFVLAVSIDAQNSVEIAKVRSAHFDWVKSSAVLNSISDLQSVEVVFAGRGMASGRSLLSLTLKGSFSLSEHAYLDGWYDVWSARFRHLELDRTELAVRPNAADFESLGTDGPLVEAARLLAAAAADPAHPDHVIAPLALLRLFGFASEAAREGVS